MPQNFYKYQVEHKRSCNLDKLKPYFIRILRKLKTARSWLPEHTCICPVELVGDPINCQASRALQTGIHYHLGRKQSCVTLRTPRPALEPKLHQLQGMGNTSPPGATGSGWPYLLSCSIPLGPADGISADICPVHVVIPGVPVKGHCTAHVSQWDDIVGQVLCVEADPTDVHPSGKKQDLVKP